LIERDPGYAAMLSLAAEMVLDEAIRRRKQAALYEAIDRALEEGDVERFLVLSSELKRLYA